MDTDLKKRILAFDDLGILFHENFIEKNDKTFPEWDSILDIKLKEAKSLKFLSIKGMYRAIGFSNRNENYPQLTDHYFTGDYPVKPIDELGDNKITQLSLLSTASNN